MERNPTTSRDSVCKHRHNTYFTREKADPENSTFVEAPIERTQTDNTDDMKTHSFYPVIDRLMVEMKRHFSTEANDVLRGVPTLSLKHTSFLDKQLLLPMARHYGVSEENLSAELYQVRRFLQRKEEQRHTIHSTKEFHSLMRPYKDAFMDLYTLICIALTLSVTSVSCDAVFLAWAV